MHARLAFAAAGALLLCGIGATGWAIAAAGPHLAVPDGEVTLDALNHRAAFVFLSPGTMLLRHGDTVDWLSWDRDVESIAVVDITDGREEALVDVPINPSGPTYTCSLDYSRATPLMVESAVRRVLD